MWHLLLGFYITSSTLTGTLRGDFNIKVFSEFRQESFGPAAVSTSHMDSLTHLTDRMMKIHAK